MLSIVRMMMTLTVVGVLAYVRGEGTAFNVAAVLTVGALALYAFILIRDTQYRSVRATRNPSTSTAQRVIANTKAPSPNELRDRQESLRTMMCILESGNSPAKDALARRPAGDSGGDAGRSEPARGIGRETTGKEK